MMVRQDYNSSNETRIALYCKFLNNEGKDYQYISFILDDEKIIDYYFEEEDANTDTYSIFFEGLELGKVYNIKVIAKLNNGMIFEVGTLWCGCIKKYKTTKINNCLVEEKEDIKIAPPTNISFPKVEGVHNG